MSRTRSSGREGSKRQGKKQSLGSESLENLERAELASMYAALLLSECAEGRRGGEKLTECAAGLWRYVRHLVSTVEKGSCRLDALESVIADVRMTLRTLAQLTRSQLTLRSIMGPGLKSRMKNCARMLETNAAGLGSL